MLYVIVISIDVLCSLEIIPFKIFGTSFCQEDHPFFTQKMAKRAEILETWSLELLTLKKSICHSFQPFK